MPTLKEVGEIALELAGIIASFSRSSILKGYYCGSITKDLFNSEEEYQEFYELLINYMNKVSLSHMFDERVKLTTEVTNPIIGAFTELYMKYPSQTEVFMLEGIYDIKNPSHLKRSLAKIKSKDVVSKKMIIAPKKDGNEYYRFIGMLSSSNITSYIPEVKYSKKEEQFLNDFCTSLLARKLFEYLKPEDLGYAAIDKRFASAAYFSCLTIFTLEDETLDEKYDKFVTYIKGEIKNIDTEKLKLMMFYRYFEKVKSLENITISDLQELEGMKNLLEKTLANIAISEKGFCFQIPELNSFEFDLVSSITGKPFKREPKRVQPSILSVPNKEELLKGFSDNTSHVSSNNTFSSEQDFPVLIITDDSNYRMRDVEINEVIETSKRDLNIAMDAFIINQKLSLLVRKCRDDLDIDEYLKQDLINETMIRMIEATTISISTQNEEELRKIKTKVLKRLLTEKMFKINEALIFDTNILCEALRNKTIDIEDITFDRIKNTIDKTALIEVALSSPELLEKLLETNNISKDDLFKLNLSSYKELAEKFFNIGTLSLEDLILLIKQNKLSPKDITDINIPALRIDDNLIVSIYLQIQKKKNEYSRIVKAKYEEALANGIEEDKVQETDEEKKLQAELQQLIDLKNIYIVLYQKQNISKLEYAHRTQDIYYSIFDSLTGETLDQDLRGLTESLYEDKMISMVQIQDLDDNLFIGILKSGLAKKTDIIKFKEELISVGDLLEIREALKDKYSGEELEEQIKIEANRLRLGKLEKLMFKIMDDPSNTKEEKLNILYSLYSGSSIDEREYREFFESMILVRVYEKIKNKAVILNPQEELLDDDEEKDPSKKYGHRKFVYSTDIIWSFMQLLDPDCQSQVLADGYVLFKSEKLNKVFIENLWQTNRSGEFVRRGYGTATVILDYDTFKAHETEIIKLRSTGYKVDMYEAKANLPRIQTPTGERVLGAIIHEKDLQNTGKKVWFELIMERLGIDTKTMESRDSIYTKEELEEIKKFVNESRYRYEEIDSK